MKKFEVTIKWADNQNSQVFEAETPADAARKSREAMKEAAYIAWDIARPFSYEKFLENLESTINSVHNVVGVKEVA
jgi:hypothetical protein